MEIVYKMYYFKSFKRCLYLLSIEFTFIPYNFHIVGFFISRPSEEEVSVTLDLLVMHLHTKG